VRENLYRADLRQKLRETRQVRLKLRYPPKWQYVVCVCSLLQRYTASTWMRLMSCKHCAISTCIYSSQIASNQICYGVTRKWTNAYQRSSPLIKSKRKSRYQAGNSKVSLFRAKYFIRAYRQYDKINPNEPNFQRYCGYRVFFKRFPRGARALAATSFSVNFVGRAVGARPEKMLHIPGR